MNTYKKLEKNKPVGNLYLEQNLIETVDGFTENMSLEEVEALGYCKFDNASNNPNHHEGVMRTWTINGAKKGEDGIWENTWEAETGEGLDEVEGVHKLAKIRKSRNELLARTDYAGLGDSPEMSEDMKTYRQTLRDMTDGLSGNFKVEDIEWPAIPDNPHTTPTGGKHSK